MESTKKYQTRVKLGCTLDWSSYSTRFTYTHATLSKNKSFPRNTRLISQKFTWTKFYGYG